jgi:regulator of protease activity HflC (stomatin/prohibitin superfamily)
MNYALIILLIIGVFILLSSFTVKQQTSVIIERFEDFTASANLDFN